MKKFFYLPLAVIALILACGLDDNGGTIVLPKKVTSGGTLQGLPFVPGSIPSGTSNFLQNVQMNEVVISGGSADLAVSSSQRLDELYIQIGGENGYYVVNRSSGNLIEVSSGNGVYNYQALMQLSQDLRDADMQISLSGRSGTAQEAQTSTVVTREVKVKAVGTGALQISLTWNNYDDLDLYVTPPGGLPIYWNRTKVGNGELDMDALGCNGIGHTQNENIFFTPPLADGDYIVHIIEYERCGGSTGATYSVTSRINGQLFTISDKQQGKFSGSVDSIRIGVITIKNGTLASGCIRGTNCPDDLVYCQKGAAANCFQTTRQGCLTSDTDGIVVPSCPIIPVCTPGKDCDDDMGSCTGGKSCYQISRKECSFQEGDFLFVYGGTCQTTPGTGTFTDARDGKTYKQVTIGTQVWMAENLNYRNSTGSSDTVGVCYGNSEETCDGDKYGRLYTWNEAMAGASSSSTTPSGVQGVCPLGWHLPSDAEWDILIKYIDPTHTSGSHPTAGSKLKSQTGWTTYSGVSSTDEYGFSALPGGYRGSGGNFDDAGYNGGWWGATEYDATGARIRGMTYGSDVVGSGWNYKTIGFSVRCLRD